MKVGDILMFAATQPVPDGFLTIPSDWLPVADYHELYLAIRDKEYVETDGDRFRMNDFNLVQALPGGGEVVMPTAGLRKDGAIVIIKARP